ncbi:MAG: L-ribulose-5-phosphate 4-epimerase [Actinomycetota bacterium]|nr:L-ribulose-5-phosphate 4-epimerase [Actinomycetota bacterium]
MLEQLKQHVYEANIKLVKNGLVIYTFGNVSAIDRDRGIMAIKPSGVDYDKLKPEDMVLVDLEANIVEGKLNPSSDTKTHLELYKEFADIGGVAHTHSTFATAWAQAKRPIPCLGTTHADYFYGEVPCTEVISDQQIQKDYEQQTGQLILDTFNSYNYNQCQAVLVARHGPFTWGKDAAEAVFVSTILESIARASLYSVMLNPDIEAIKQTLLDQHYLRKHGDGASYGQESGQ